MLFKKIISMFYKGVLLNSAYKMFIFGTFSNLLYIIFNFLAGNKILYTNIMLIYTISFLIAVLIYSEIIFCYLLKKKTFDKIHLEKIKKDEDLVLTINIVPDIKAIVDNLLW